MLRLAAFFLLVVLLYNVLGSLPWIGPTIRSLGCIGIWLVAIGLSWAVTRWGEMAVVRRRDSSEIRRLRAVASPHNRGKLGSLYLQQGRPKKALPCLQEAAAGEPGVAEWHYRLGLARLAQGETEAAIEALRRAAEIDAEHAYGAVQLRLAEALAGAGRYEESLAALDVHARNHGPNPENAYRRGMALKRLGRGEEAREAFREVGRLAAEAARYKRREAGAWAVRARLASLFV